MVPYLAVLVILVAGVTTSNAATRCCTPPQWESIISQIGGVHPQGSAKSSVFTNIVLYSYDAKNKRIAMRITTNTTGTVYHSKVIQDYQAKRLYTIVGPKCTYTKLPLAFQKSCIPANATYMGRFYLGNGKSKMSIDSWQALFQQLTVFFTVSTDGQCVPITEVVYGAATNVEEMITMGFINLTTGIKDPNVFKPPSGCSPAHYMDNLYFKKLHPTLAKLSNYMAKKHSFL